MNETPTFTSHRDFLRWTIENGERVWVHYFNLAGQDRLSEATGWVLSVTRRQFTIQTDAGLLTLRLDDVEEAQIA